MLAMSIFLHILSSVLLCVILWLGYFRNGFFHSEKKIENKEKQIFTDKISHEDHLDYEIDHVAVFVQF